MTDQGYTLEEDRRRQREAEAYAATTELIVRAAERNRPELAPAPWGDLARDLQLQRAG